MTMEKFVHILDIEGNKFNSGSLTISRIGVRSALLLVLAQCFESVADTTDVGLIPVADFHANVILQLNLWV